MSQKRSSRFSFKDSDDEEEKKVIIPAASSVGPASHFQSHGRRLGQIVRRSDDNNGVLAFGELALRTYEMKMKEEQRVREVREERWNKINNAMNKLLRTVPVYVKDIVVNLVLEAKDTIIDNYKWFIAIGLTLLVREVISKISLPSAEIDLGPFKFSFNK